MCLGCVFGCGSRSQLSIVISDTGNVDQKKKNTRNYLILNHIMSFGVSNKILHNLDNNGV